MKSYPTDNRSVIYCSVVPRSWGSLADNLGRGLPLDLLNQVDDVIVGSLVKPVVQTSYTITCYTVQGTDLSIIISPITQLFVDCRTQRRLP